ncbi:hypothetical protein PC120_g28104 [Phytophthora cactorum]|nr:hypothetical protein PC120_g28104 [Phytophthora cactorum]
MRRVMDSAAPDDRTQGRRRRSWQADEISKAGEDHNVTGGRVRGEREAKRQGDAAAREKADSE